ncbi:hypothetical protein N802_15295 [Knoellia sinensis KCTC 19936]|uniref:Uncharacterized protein n=1 Tax=Knoellia sinensis KCTC 19936 TaxID=1385520 RepID=A0A0A0IVT9_9MICO|nr:hypothetical protein N802_15295 [Knoellia sinensis KCTC 19936]
MLEPEPRPSPHQHDTVDEFSPVDDHLRRGEPAHLTDYP